MELEGLMNTRFVEAEFNSMMNRLGQVFPSEPGFRTCQKYIKGLIGPAERKNGWQLSEAAGEPTPYQIQQFLYRGSSERQKNPMHLLVHMKIIPCE